MPDDGKKEPWHHVVDGETVTFHPLYNDDMRAAVARLTDASEKSTQPSDAGHESDETEDDKAGHVNLEAWLRGEANYQPYELRAAAKARYSRQYSQIYPTLVVDLVLDEKLVPEDEVCDAFKRYLPQKNAA